MLAFRWSGGAGAGRDGRRAAGRRRAVQLLDRVRRGADPEGVPARRAGRQPRARAAALPVRARLPAHRPDRRLVPVRRAADGRDARRAAGVPGRRDRRLGPRARRARRRPRGVPRARCTRSASVTGELHTALGSEASDPAFAPEEPSTEAISILTATIDEEIERIFVELPEDEAIDPIRGRGQDVQERLQMLAVGRRRRARDPHPRRLPPRPDHARRPRLGDPRLRGRAGAADVRSGG